MLENLAVVLIVGLAIVTTVLLLGIGTAAGYRLGVRAGATRTLTIAADVCDSPELLNQIRACRELVAQIQLRTGLVLEIASAQLELLPSTFREAVEGLVELAHQLANELERDRTFPAPQLVHTVREQDRAGQRCANGPREAPRVELSPRRTTTPSLTNNLTGDELHVLTGLAGNQSHARNDAALSRYAYQCHQIVYAWYDDELEAIAPGKMVLCHEISVTGVTFFWPDEPGFRRLILALGSTANPIYMAAEVAHSKVVYMHGETQFVVGCRFTGRVPEFSEEARMQINRRRAGGAASVGAKNMADATCSAQLAG